MPGAVKPHERLRDRLKPGRKKNGACEGTIVVKSPQPNDLLFPGNYLKMFNNLLDSQSLKLDRDDKPRTAYSFRHTYICLRLMEGADVYAIAKNCRTSVEMIEKFYAAHIKTTLDASAINARKPKRANRERRVTGRRHRRLRRRPGVLQPGRHPKGCRSEPLAGSPAPAWRGAQRV